VRVFLLEICGVSHLRCTAEMSRSVVAVARLVGRSRRSALASSLSPIQAGSGLVADGSGHCDHSMARNRAVSGAQVWCNKRVHSRALSDQMAAKWTQVPFLFFCTAVSQVCWSFSEDSSLLRVVHGSLD
jgi:hypothetical protein